MAQDGAMPQPAPLFFYIVADHEFMAVLSELPQSEFKDRVAGRIVDRVLIPEQDVAYIHIAAQTPLIRETLQRLVLQAWEAGHKSGLRCELI